jgi:hypothetical protein
MKEKRSFACAAGAEVKPLLQWYVDSSSLDTDNSKALGVPALLLQLLLWQLWRQYLKSLAASQVTGSHMQQSGNVFFFVNAQVNAVLPECHSCSEGAQKEKADSKFKTLYESVSKKGRIHNARDCELWAIPTHLCHMVGLMCRLQSVQILSDATNAASCGTLRSLSSHCQRRTGELPVEICPRWFWGSFAAAAVTRYVHAEPMESPVRHSLLLAMLMPYLLTYLAAVGNKSGVSSNKWY